MHLFLGYYFGSHRREVSVVVVLFGVTCMILYCRLCDSNWWVAVSGVCKRSSAGFPSRMSLVPAFSVFDYVLHSVGGDVPDYFLLVMYSITLIPLESFSSRISSISDVAFSVFGVLLLLLFCCFFSSPRCVVLGCGCQILLIRFLREFLCFVFRGFIFLI